MRLAHIRTLRWAGAERLSRPVAVTSIGGRVYVSDIARNLVVQYSPQGKWLSSYGRIGSGPRDLFSPCGLSVTPDGKLVVADTNNNRLVLLTQELEPAGVVALPLPTVSEVACRPNGRFVLGAGQYSSTALPVYECAASGRGLRALAAANVVKLATDARGNLLCGATNASEARPIHEIDPSGREVARLGTSASHSLGPDRLYMLGGLFANERYLIATSYGDGRLVVYDRQGRYLGGLSNEEMQAGLDRRPGFGPLMPSGITLDRLGQLWVCLPGRHVVQVFALREEPGAPRQEGRAP